MLKVEEEIRITNLIGPLVWISGPNLPYILPMLRLRISTLRNMDYAYSSMFFVKKLIGPIYYIKSAYSSRVLKELSDPTHPQSTYPAAVAARNKKK